MMEENKLVPKVRFKEFKGDFTQEQLSNLGRFGKSYSFSRAKEGLGSIYHIHYGDIHTKKYGIINSSTNIPTLSENGDFDFLKSGDIVIADASEDYKDLGKSVVIGKINDKKIISGLHTFKFTPSKKLFSQYFLYFTQTKYYKDFSAKIGTGISVFGISKDNMGKLPVKYPSLKEQEKIGEFFKVLDERIANQERKIAKVKALKEAYLTEMFPQEGETVPKRRFKGFEGEWEVAILKDIILDEFKGKANANQIGGTTPYLETDYLNGGKKSLIKANYDVEYDDVLILWDGSNAGKVYHGFEGALGSTLKTLKPKYSGSYLYYYMTLYQKVIYNNYRTPNIPHVINTFTDEFKVKLPSKKEQAKIGEFFKNLDGQIEAEEKKLEKLKKTKEAYLEEMFV